MRLDNIRLKNFRCYQDVAIAFHPRCNVFVGINGTGKTSVLEAVRIAVGSLFLGVDKYKDKIASPSIMQDDVRLANMEQQFPVCIYSDGEVDGSAIAWERSLETKGGITRYTNAKAMREASKHLQEKIRDIEHPSSIPLIAYYSTDRFKKEKRDAGVEPDGSRLRGYYNALDPLTNIKFFLDLYFTETLSALQHQTQSAMLNAVNEAVKKCINGCEDVVFDIKQQELLITLADNHENLPFHVLSDGVRSMLAMVMEMAFRCFLLNPHLRERAAMETAGVVLIDEIDLHLHPEWQKRVVGDLRRAFPKIQFMLTTHAPLVLGSLRDGKIISIKDNQAYDFPSQHGRDANYILNEMGTAEMEEQVKRSLQDYFILLEKGLGRTKDAIALRTSLESLLGERHTELQRADMMLDFF